MRTPPSTPTPFFPSLIQFHFSSGRYEEREGGRTWGEKGVYEKKKVKHIVAYLLGELFNASAIFSPKGRVVSESGERGQIHTTGHWWLQS